jgi:hypothetical protein
MTTDQAPGVTPLMLEFLLAVVMVALAVCFPRMGVSVFPRLEMWLDQLARRRTLSIFVCGAFPCAIRLLILPIVPIPQPWIMDDFSFLLAADTYASGRLTNSTPPLWTHFESFHITLVPTYMSMYFPAQGMVLAAGKILTGHPWFGVWASCGIMSAALCWALQGWLPARWALFGGLLSGLRLGLFSYWMNTYTGGAVAAIGGSLVIGALPRIRRGFHTQDFFYVAVGMALLATSRPYEGLLVCVPVLAVIAWSFWKQPHPNIAVLLVRVAPAGGLLTAVILFMGYYDYRLYGNVLTPPYTVNRAAYAVAPHFLWQSVRLEPSYRHRVMQTFYTGPSPFAEMYWYVREKESVTGFLKVAVQKLSVAGFFYLNFALAPLLLGLPWAIRDRRIRVPVLLALLYLAGLAAETWFIPHYAAPGTVLLYIILLQCMRHVRASGGPGLFLARATPVLCATLVVLHVFVPLKLPADVYVMQSWYGSRPVGLDRARVAAQLENHPGPQLAIVRYAPNHLYPEWVYNAANINGSRVVWAREMDAVANRELLDYFKNRTAWLVEPDSSPARVSPYPSPLLSDKPELSVLVAAPKAGNARGETGARRQPMANP